MVPRARRWISRDVGREHLVLPSPAAGGRKTGTRGDPAPHFDAATRVTDADGSLPAHLPPPPPISPIASPPVAGEGQWHAVGRLVHGLPAVYEAYLRPDAVHTSVVVGVAWMDTKLLSATLVFGKHHPRWRAVGKHCSGVHPIGAVTRGRVQRGLPDVERRGRLLHPGKDCCTLFAPEPRPSSSTTTERPRSVSGDAT